MTNNEPQNPIETESQPKSKPRRGFALLTPEKRSEIARQGGKTAHQKGTAHRWTSDAARLAGKTGGSSIARDREYMKEIGRRGGAGKKGCRQRKEARLREQGKEPSDKRVEKESMNRLSGTNGPVGSD